MTESIQTNRMQESGEESEAEGNCMFFLSPFHLVVLQMLAMTVKTTQSTFQTPPLLSLTLLLFVSHATFTPTYWHVSNTTNVVQKLVFVLAWQSNKQIFIFVLICCCFSNFISGSWTHIQILGIKVFSGLSLKDTSRQLQTGWAGFPQSDGESRLFVLHNSTFCNLVWYKYVRTTEANQIICRSKTYGIIRKHMLEVICRIE